LEFWEGDPFLLVTGDPILNRHSRAALLGVEVSFFWSGALVDIDNLSDFGRIDSSLEPFVDSATKESCDDEDSDIESESFFPSSSIFLQLIARTNTPCIALHVKYLFPWQRPSCRPLASRNSNPTHTPLENSVLPMKRTDPNSCDCSLGLELKLRIKIAEILYSKDHIQSYEQLNFLRSNSCADEVSDGYITIICYCFRCNIAFC
jgi:hypothetical protein